MKPWMVARVLFNPPDESGVRSPALTRLGFWRSALGLATVAVVGLSYGKSPYDSAKDNSLDVVVNAGMSVVVMLVCILGIYLVTRRGQRRTLVRGTGRMLRNLVLVLFTVVTPVALINLTATAGNPAATVWIALILTVCGPLPCLALAYPAQRDRLTPTALRRYRIALALSVVMTVVLITLILADVHTDVGTARLLTALSGVLQATWWLLYLPCAIYWTARTVMWVGEVHPMLAPIGATLLVAVVLTSKLTAYKPDQVPFDVWLPMSLTGLVTTFVVAAFEIRHLRRSGVRLRNGV
ncbi:hypothetical protein [Amycolatopsis sp. H20-H5]|uniref:hypothetical protein n=1 Tax=Amycolatopsis sp. H20-H5 TaxID=3046309 RepID=UPI002DB93A7C|nr:hypothetical protein [Amycolatopsis sp. H20-H5]MEC3978281.1 hypothetical protein [Amycolatopsis sp. H20-H5]